ncbi:MAG: glycosyl transferase [Planctomycetes bacterium]|nr:glycosyl transferase [Planctomycetota bacterium]
MATDSVRAETTSEPGPVLSVVVPVFNEASTLEVCMGRVFASDCGVSFEVIAVDDGSSDGSLGILERCQQEHSGLQVLRHEHNQGKGAALRTAFAVANGQYVLVQDADLEYDPQDYRLLLSPLLDGRADVVYGSRFLGGAGRAHLYFNYLANRFLTTVSNVFTNLNLTDMETGYKVFRRDVAQRLDIRSPSFAVEPEMTAKAARMGARIFEVAISYNGRDYEEGKKIRWTDGLAGLWAILRFNLFPGRIERLQRPPPGTGPVSD